MHSKIFRKISKLKIGLPVLLLFVLSGCAVLDIFGRREPPKASPEGIYAMAAEEYKDGDYKKAREYFMRVKEEYPLHEMAVLAGIGVADSFYSDGDYVQAEDAYNDFISMQPVNENVPYAIYQMGMCHYNQMEAIDRDQAETVKARHEWEKLIARYPESKFAIMAEKMLKEVKQRLAKREFYVGNFYLINKKYKAALARFEKIASEYSNVGFDYKIENYINEAKAKLAEEEKEKLEKENKKKMKEEQKLSKEEEKKEAERLKREAQQKRAEEEKIKKEEEKKRKEEEKLKKEEADKKKKEEEKVRKEEERKKKEEEKLKKEEEQKRKEEEKLKQEAEDKKKKEEKNKTDQK